MTLTLKIRLGSPWWTQIGLSPLRTDGSHDRLPAVSLLHRPTYVESLYFVAILFDIQTLISETAELRPATSTSEVWF